MLPHSSFAVAVVQANYSINISHYQQQVVLRDSGYFILELFIPVVFYLIFGLVSRGITLQYSKLTIFGMEPCSDDSIADRFPFNESLFYASVDDKGNTICMSFAFSFPENKIVKPSLVFFLPAPVHLHSLTPRMSRSYLSISFVTCAVLPVSNIVRTFHVASRTIVLGPRVIIWADIGHIWKEASDWLIPIQRGFCLVKILMTLSGRPLSRAHVKMKRFDWLRIWVKVHQKQNGVAPRSWVTLG